MNNKCITCGKYVPPFSPNPSYCSKKCEEEGGGVVGQLRNMLGMF